MMSLIFLLLLISALFAVFKQRDWAIGFLIITIIIASYWFYHHASSHLNIVL